MIHTGHALWFHNGALNDLNAATGELWPLNSNFKTFYKSQMPIIVANACSDYKLD